MLPRERTSEQNKQTASDAQREKLFSAQRAEASGRGHAEAATAGVAQPTLPMGRHARRRHHFGMAFQPPHAITAHAGNAGARATQGTGRIHR